MLFSSIKTSVPKESNILGVNTLSMFLSERTDKSWSRMFDEIIAAGYDFQNISVPEVDAIGDIDYSVFLAVAQDAADFPMVISYDLAGRTYVVMFDQYRVQLAREFLSSLLGEHASVMELSTIRLQVQEKEESSTLNLGFGKDDGISRRSLLSMVNEVTAGLNAQVMLVASGELEQHITFDLAGLQHREAAEAVKAALTRGYKDMILEASDDSIRTALRTVVASLGEKVTASLGVEIAAKSDHEKWTEWAKKNRDKFTEQTGFRLSPPQSGAHNDRTSRLYITQGMAGSVSQIRYEWTPSTGTVAKLGLGRTYESVGKAKTLPSLIALIAGLHPTEQAGVFEDADLQEGQRVVINDGTAADPKYLLGTVISPTYIVAINGQRLARVRVQLDNGMEIVEQVDNGLTGVMGTAKVQRRKLDPINPVHLKAYLDNNKWMPSAVHALIGVPE